MQWRVISDSALHCRFWNDECVVYNALSGDTHLLGMAASQILLQLQQAPSDTIGLVDSLAHLLQPEMDEEFSLQHVERLLADLDTLGLIERS